MRKMESPLISVIITVFNLEDYIEKCILSVCAQSYTNLQIIVVDDGSTDKSLVKCKSLAEIDKRIEVIHQTNKGSGAAKNKGIQLAKGQYIGFVDGDDCIEKNMYMNLVKACLSYDADIAWCGRNVMSEDGKKLYDLFSSDKYEMCDSNELVKKIIMRKECDSATWDKLFKSDVWKSIRFEENTKFDDLLPSVRLATAVTTKAVHIPDNGYNYLLRNDSICHQKFGEGKFDMYKEAKKVQKFVKDRYPEYKKEADEFLTFYANKLITQAYNAEGINRNQILHLWSIYKEMFKILFSNIKYFKINIKIFLKLLLLSMKRRSE